ncbi:MAG TPA: peptidoglycan editing factor PgeF [Actinomycetota bacterium]
MERRALTDGLNALVPEGMESHGFLAAFTERRGGVSEPPYDSLNLGLHTGDRPDVVAENRRLVVRTLGLDRWAAGEQVHGGGVVRVDERWASRGWDGPPIDGADALAVARAGLPVAVLTADCLPIALASPLEGLLVAVHAGWRGLAAGIVDAALASFDRPGEIHAAIGPAIGPCHYEVGEDVGRAVSEGSATGAVTDRRNGRLYLDLPATAVRVLRAGGVRRIDRADLCTACEEDRFFSHRRDGITGRQALVAVRL